MKIYVAKEVDAIWN